MTGAVCVKVCGVRRPQDAELAVDLGAGYVGCVLAPDSPRCATLDDVAAVRSAVGAVVGVVLVFRGQETDEVLAAVDATGVDRVQIHGVDPAVPDALAARGLAVHRVIAVPADARALPPAPAVEPSPDCPAILDVGHGGAGRRFDWSLLESGCPANTLIAGGITPDNVAGLLRWRPFGIDVSSGLESAPGIKDPARLRRLFAALGADR